MKTLALVLGNNNYYEGVKLSNAVNDATAIKDVFERLGFEIIFNTDFVAAESSAFLAEFSTKIKNCDASIFYFAGHGFELEGENYLAPINSQIPPANKFEANRMCIRLNEVLDILKENPRKIHIVIIDACRKSFDRGSIVGFSPIQTPQGTLIAFSTSPNEGASDTGVIGHSVYTGALLQYIGRERLSVEDLLKKVRKTVYDLTNGKQTTWEHTSLIGDYYFNEGQMVYQINIPYDEKVVKDAYYDNTSSEFGKLIMAIKSYNWYVQNPAIDKLLGIPANQLDKNQQFILGRNLLQSSNGNAASACNFMENIRNKIYKYNIKDENHLLNGILYEIYFNSYGDFRRDKTKKSQFFEKIIDLRKAYEFNKSFEFIVNLLNATQYPLIFIPKQPDEIIDINVKMEETENEFEGKQKYQLINSIKYNDIDITKQIAEISWSGTKSKQEIKQIIANFFTAPVSLISIHCNIEPTSIRFDKSILDDNIWR